MSPAIAAVRRTAPPATYWTCYVGLLLAGLSILLALSLGEPRLLHWYVIPAFLCLSIVCLDTAHLACGNVSFFSPVGLFGLFGFHFFFVAPLLNVYLDYWMNYTLMPEGLAAVARRHGLAEPGRPAGIPDRPSPGRRKFLHRCGR